MWLVSAEVTVVGYRTVNGDNAAVADRPANIRSLCVRSARALFYRQQVETTKHSREIGVAAQSRLVWNNVAWRR